LRAGEREEQREDAHAHLALLYPANQMTVEKALEAAIAGERYEHTVMYPGFEHDARFTAMLEQARRRFAHLTTVGKEHADRYQAALDQRKKS